MLWVLIEVCTNQDLCIHLLDAFRCICKPPQEYICVHMCPDSYIVYNMWMQFCRAQLKNSIIRISVEQMQDIEEAGIVIYGYK